MKPPFTVQPSNNHLPRSDAFHAYKSKMNDLRENKLPPSDTTLNSVSSISVGSQHIAEKKEAKDSEQMPSDAGGEVVIF